MLKKPIALVLPLIIIIFSIANSLALSEPDLISITESTETYQNGEGSSSLILYSGIRNVFEDNKWKRVEDARSLKGKGFDVVFLDQDPELIIEVIDFNYSSLTYKAKVKGSNIGKNVPIKIYREDPNFDVIKWISKNPGKELKWKDKVIKKSEKSHIFVNEADALNESIPFGLDYYLEFGENSTVIILQDADTENLDDTQTEREDGFYYNHGASTTIKIDIARDWRVYIKFDLQQIPTNAVINEAYLYLFPAGTDDITTVSAFHVFDHTWEEGNGTGTACFIEADCNGGITHDRQPCGTDFDNFQQCNLTAEYSLLTPGIEKWHIYNVTNMARTEYSDADNNVSIILRGTAPGPIPQVYYNSKEAVNISTRPYLNVTYSQANSTDLEILEVIPIQVLRDVDMVKDKSGIVRVVVRNNGPLDANATVNATLDGSLLSLYPGESANKSINASKNQTFDFSFKPAQTGIRTIRAEVKVE